MTSSMNLQVDEKTMAYDLYDNSAVQTKEYTFTFNSAAGDGVQIIGTPGGTSTFTSIGELVVYFDG